jgi:2'-5' RNA ligase
LTLARLSECASPDERQGFGQLIASTKFEADDIEVNNISLMKSQLTRTGAIYTRISLVNLRESRV